MTARRLLPANIALLLVLFGSLCVSPRILDTPDPLPDHLSDAAFWELVQTFSEDGGYFRSDNLISNEDTFQHVIPTLREQLAPGGVYLGVGPDQNFTYVVAIRPRMAFIVDIRRQNMLLHLMYKALIEMSADRSEFIARLFSRDQVEGATASWTPRALFDAYSTTTARDAVFRANLTAILYRLTHVHRFSLSADDLAAIEYVYRAFFEGGPDLRYSFPRQFAGGRWFPSYAELMMETDAEGEQHSYLATEKNYQSLRAYEANNLVIPVVGDFGGNKALRSIAGYLKAHDARVTLFYTSNVEQYLFQGSAWRRFFANVGALPADQNSAILRSFFNTGVRYSPGTRINPAGRSAMLVDSISNLLAVVRRGEIQSYYDVIQRSR